MRATYKCPKCGISEDITFSIVEGPPKEVVCASCGELKQRMWGASIHIPEDFSDDLTTTIIHKMSHGMPSGKTKINY